MELGFEQPKTQNINALQQIQLTYYYDEYSNYNDSKYSSSPK
ncbi:hypothetical protein pb186bvf_012864 [Paramecium bursaria]